VSDVRPVNLTTGVPSTVLPPEPQDALAALQEALAAEPGARRDAIAAICARYPTFLDAWARLGDHARDDVEAYACYRVGLDRLRASGWRGSGYVRWSEQTNRGFLRALRGLGRTAAQLGEHDEAERCAQFLAQLDPAGIPAEG
jgi:tetratricopeptide (TPR) repeat protein